MRRSCTLALILILIAPSSVLQAHYIKLRGKLVEPGTLTFGVALTGRPFAYRQDGELMGFEIDWARAVAESRGLELTVVQLHRARLVESLGAGEVDLVNSFLMEQTPPEIILLPFLVTGDHMMVLKANPFRIRGPRDLAGHVVSTTAGSSGEAYAREINEELIAAGQEAMDIHSFPNQRDTHFPVSMGHAAAFFSPTRSALVPGLDPESRVTLLEGAFKQRREVGFALRAGDAELADAVQHAIAAKVANGTFDRLRKAHGLPDDLSPYR